MASDYRKKYLKPLAFILGPNIGGLLISIFSGTNTLWYQSLNKPVLTPPSIIFPIAWTILYSLMGYSFYLALESGIEKQGKILFGIQYTANLLWTPVFFKYESPLYALLVIIFLNIAIIGTITEFYKENKTSAYLLLPYLVWTLFALYLNLQIVLLN